jgi:ubiquilin
MSNIEIYIKSSTEGKTSVTISSSCTVAELKEKISNTLSDCPVEIQRLIYSGRVLKDEETLSLYKISDGHT